ncbi:MAG: hypothetical protein IPM34_07740 [Saprospiraceae bacterium]|nr:hypothetical protein [Saprospiraceae bacterium]
MDPIYKYNKIWLGLVVGFLVPFTAYGILLSLYDQLDHWEIFNPVGLSPTFRERTVALLALVCNVIPMQFFNKRYMLFAMRGLIFPTLIYVALWMYYFGLDLLG